MTKLTACISLPLCLLVLAGCIPDEEPIAPYDRGSAMQATVAMGSDYRTQLFFSLEQGRVIHSNTVTDWDLGFRSDAEGHQVILNSGQIASVADLGGTEFEAAVTTGGLTWDYDRPSGEWDSTAIGTWWTGTGTDVQSKNHLYIVDRGYTPAGKAIGYAKLMILSATETEYTIRVAALDNSDDRTVTIPRDTARNFTGFSLEPGKGIVEVEPPRRDWDLLFTRYTHIFYAPDFTPYSVTGILLNRFRTEATADSALTFAEVSLETQGYDMVPRLDIIGYDWKSFDLNTGLFTVDSPVYIIRDSKGFIYKLHLLDFYNNEGEKGFPTMEWQKL